MGAAWPGSNLLFYKALADTVAGFYKNLTVRPIRLLITCPNVVRIKGCCNDDYD
jgi:hypothetical protein